MNWIKSIVLPSAVTLLCLLVIEFSIKFFYESVDPFNFEEWMESKPKAFQNDPDFDMVLKGFDGKCKYPTPLHENGFSTYLTDWSCGEVTVTNGKRLTKPKPESWTQTIHIFGGSTIWGRGALDDKTIPSLIQAALRDNNIRVLNYGMMSYVNMQQTELLRAQRSEVQKGDIVIYNDGMNDFYNSVMYGNSDGFMIGFNTRNKAKIYEHLFKGWLYENIYTYRLLSDMKHGKKRPTQDMECSIDPEQAKARVEGSAEHLVKRVREAKKLSESLGANFIHFYQPTLLDSKSLTEYELEILSHYPCMRIARPLKHRYNKVFLGASKESIDQTDLLVGTDSFFDYTHTAFGGNKIIADNIVETILRKEY